MTTAKVSPWKKVCAVVASLAVAVAFTPLCAPQKALADEEQGDGVTVVDDCTVTAHSAIYGTTLTAYCPTGFGTVPAGTEVEITFTIDDPDATIQEISIPERNDHWFCWQQGVKDTDTIVVSSIMNSDVGGMRFVVETSKGHFEFDPLYYVAPQAPKQVMLETKGGDLYIETGMCWPETHGQYILVQVDGNSYQINTGESARIALKPGKKYDVDLYGWAVIKGENVFSPVVTKKNVLTGPTTKPVIKSIKISNAKSKKYFDYSTWKYRYKTTWTATITLSKKASGTKGILVKDQSATYKVKGTGKTFKVKMSRDSGVSYKGKKLSFQVMTYSDGTYGAYSPVSAAKSVTIK